ncbi:hypothetical protein LVO39_004880 [Salmonella enterica]|uniref:Uncharacterized protein n=1 Tax=Salmonella enterica TaxID=28901 RepID=A0A765BSN4_SALER|nr:hypothetical protein [Salmonella enterica]EDR9714678.1 hypothetical protein [Salmonella enterica subsp. diarizonae]EHE8613286.1 hypothetical protein [Salmonella enterica subsp. enterica serovar 4,[5],12:b:-]EIR2445104.1 hypothetical protein [Salmonella enterica subsp. enterica serovar Newport]EDS2241479.1 hypothetical protein [Salmonella enterica]EDZ4088595.1 hypothetical protein [Salmonella enterica]
MQELIQNNNKGISIQPNKKMLAAITIPTVTDSSKAIPDLTSLSELNNTDVNFNGK